MVVTINKDNEKTIKGSINTVLKGSGFVLFGYIISSIILLFSNLILARAWTKSDLGIYAISLSVLNLFSTIGTLGVARCVTRNIAYYKGKKNYKIIQDIAFSSFTLTFIASMVISVILFLLSDYIAEEIFNQSRLVLPLKIFSIAIPINNIVAIIVSVFRGFKNIRPMIYFQNIVQNAIFLASLAYIAFSKMPFVYIFYAYLLSNITTLVLLGIYSIKKKSSSDLFSNVRIRFSQTKNILLFSLPLLVVTILDTSSSWLITLLLAGIKTVAEVGLYKITVNTTACILLPVSIISVMYMPVISNLYGKACLVEIRKIYSVLTKWICFLTFPVFLVIFLFSKQFITLLYGTEYSAASYALKIVCIGAIVSNFLGPNATTLISVDKTKFVMYSTIITTSITVILSIYLIPNYGLNGAAIALSSTFVVHNIIKSSLLYFSDKIHPMSYNLIKPTMITLFTSIILFVIIREICDLRIWMMPAFLIVFYVIYFVFYLLTKSIDKEDIDLLKNIGKKIHINTKFLEKIMIKCKK